ncbi:LysM peptidoglycan-binding domain-containing protein [Zooshikella ganghwensis]|uniref:LysM domain-containing protein n=1 Tax=Zooshikella ganghwensis TaxID=202772 RepID=A0A4P9VRJ4_9GAMM|nr:LysM domain-containing protein [Zooshikella ganghwensis]RDH46193.1 LysM domain-containing protein [Zooshikella ganghwensis]
MTNTKLIKHTVKPGECLIKIAKHYKSGHWELIYQHEKNADLRAKRPDPNRLLPGDEVYITVQDVKQQAFMEQRNTFVVKRANVFMSVQLKHPNGEVLPNQPYTLEIKPGEVWDGEHELTLENNQLTHTIRLQGCSDANGIAEQQIPVQASFGVLLFAPYPSLPRYQLTQVIKFGFMPHHDSPQGHMAMLKNRGYPVHKSDYHQTDLQISAVKAFKRDRKLTTDQDWQSKLVQSAQ